MPLFSNLTFTSLLSKALFLCIILIKAYFPLPCSLLFMVFFHLVTLINMSLLHSCFPLNIWVMNNSRRRKMAFSGNCVVSICWVGKGGAMGSDFIQHRLSSTFLGFLSARRAFRRTFRYSSGLYMHVFQICSTGANQKAEEIWERVPNNAWESAAAGRSYGQIQGTGGTIDAIWEPVSSAESHGEWAGPSGYVEARVLHSCPQEGPMQILGKLSGRWNSSPFLNKHFERLELVGFFSRNISITICNSQDICK